MSAQQTTVGTWAGLPRMTPAEREAFEAIRINGKGVRAFARETNRSAGTVGNLLRRAEEKANLTEAE